MYTTICQKLVNHIGGRGNNFFFQWGLVDVEGGCCTIWLSAVCCLYSSGWSGCSEHSCSPAMPVWSWLHPFCAPSCTPPLLPQAPHLHLHRPPHSPHRYVHHAPPMKKTNKSIKQTFGANMTVLIVLPFSFAYFSPCPGTWTCRPCAGWDKPRRCAELAALTAAYWRNNNHKRAQRIPKTPPGLCRVL